MLVALGKKQKIHNLGVVALYPLRKGVVLVVDRHSIEGLILRKRHCVDHILNILQRDVSMCEALPVAAVCLLYVLIYALKVVEAEERGAIV